MPIKIENIELSVRLQNVLDQNNISSLEELFELSEQNILKLNNAGNETLKEVRALRSIYTNLHNNNKTNLETKITDLSISIRLKNRLLIAGAQTLSDLLNIDDNEFRKLHGVGDKVISELIEIKNRKDFSGLIKINNLSSISTPIDITYLPTSYNPESNTSSLHTLTRAAYIEFCSHMKTKESDVGLNRIWPAQNASADTLETIGARNNCTRERIRQIEKSVLSRVAKFFCHGSILFIKEENIHLKLHPKISKNWISATQEIIKFDEIKTYLFINILTQHLGINNSDFIQLSRFTASIYSQSINSSIEKNIERIGSHILALSDLDDHLLSTKISHLRLGKLSESIENKYDITTLQDLHVMGELLSKHESESINDILEILFKSIINNKYINWGIFCELRGFPTTTKEYHTDSNPSYLSTINKIRALLPYITKWSHCTDVFDHRTSKESKDRYTLRECSIRILQSEKLSPQIARIEKHLLGKLSKVLIYKDFSHCYTWVDQDLLDTIEKVTNIYLESEQGFEGFKKRLIQSWESNDDLKGFPHLMWSIIDGLPPNRYYHLKNKKKNTVKKSNILKFSSKKIKLKGFKMVY